MCYQCLEDHHCFSLFKDITTMFIQAIMHVYEIQHMLYFFMLMERITYR